MSIKKNELRKEILQKRDSITREEINKKSTIIINKIYELDEYKKSNVIMCYMDYRNVRFHGICLRIHRHSRPFFEEKSN